MNALFGTDNPEHNIIFFRGVELIYISIAPKDDKTKYIKHDRIRDGEIVITPLSKLREDENVKHVYVVEFFDNSEPKILPTDKFTLNFV